MESMWEPGARTADVVILTAIRLEFDAVLQVDDGAAPGTAWELETGPSGLPVAFRPFVGQGGRPLRVVAAVAPAMGATAVVNTLLPLVEALRPRCIAMCGVCAGRRGKTRLGDVIAADRLYCRDTGKQLPDEVQHDLTTYNLRDDWKAALEGLDVVEHFRDAAWFQARPITTEWREHRALAALRDRDPAPWTAADPTLAEHEWERIVGTLRERKLLAEAGRELTDEGHRFLDDLLFKYRDKMPDLSPAGKGEPFRLHVAPMGTGARVIEDERVWSFVTQAMRTTLGLEMESAALGEVAHRQRQHQLDAVVMKGVMDHAERGRDDHFKEFAARAAAECLLWFVREHVATEVASGFDDLLAPGTLPLPLPLPRRDAAWHTPNLGTHTFVGRDRELGELAALLAGSDDIQLRAAIDGLPGIGKTELARQLVARFNRDRTFPGGIYWFSAENPDLRLQWTKIAEELGAPALENLDDCAAWAVRAIAHRAQRGECTLIVLDNVETWTPPPAPLPDSSAVRLLVTTRSRWLHNSLRAYEVAPLELHHARQLLQAIVGRDVPGADELLRALGGHVLSIELAATYLREYGTAPGEYLKRLLAGKSPGSAVADRTSYRATAESAFRLLWKRLPADLREAWLLAAQLPPEWFSSELADAIDIDADRRHGLVRLHILERDDRSRHQLHRLLREFALAEVPDTSNERAYVGAGAFNALVDESPLFVFRAYRRDAVCYDHLVATLHDEPSAPFLKMMCGIALQQLGSFSAARALLEQTYESIRRILGDEHPFVGRIRTSLAETLWKLGDARAARALLERVLASDLALHGEASPEANTTRSNIALIIQTSGDLAAARPLLEQVLAQSLDLHGAGDSRVASARTNLAVVLHKLGDLPAARMLYEQALASLHGAYGEDHPEVTTTRGHLARLHLELGDLPAARALYEQALASDLRMYGEGHPEVAIMRAGLATSLRELGDLATARDLYEQVLASDLERYGEDHVKVAGTRAELAGTLHQLGELQPARILFEQALPAHLERYDEDHPEVVTMRANLGDVLAQLGELSSARTLCEQVLASDLRAHGEDHPEVAASRANLADVLAKLGELAAARVLFEQALASNSKILGEDHPSVVKILSRLDALARR